MIDPSARRSAVSLYGIVGHEVREFREFSYPWSRESCLIMHSDGLTTRWDLDRYPGLLTHDPALIAAVPRSPAVMPANAPESLPMGVRLPETMTEPGIQVLLVDGWRDGGPGRPTTGVVSALCGPPR